MGSDKKPPWIEGLTDVGTLGIQLVLSVFLGAGAGYWLDERFGTSPWLMVAGIVAGAVAGMYNAYRVIVAQDLAARQVPGRPKGKDAGKKRPDKWDDRWNKGDDSEL